MKMDVSVQVLHDHHVKLVRVHHELHAGVVDDLVERWSFAVDEPSCKSRNQHGKQRDIESMAQTGKILADIHWLGIITDRKSVV